MFDKLAHKQKPVVVIDGLPQIQIEESDNHSALEELFN